MWVPSSPPTAYLLYSVYFFVVLGHDWLTLRDVPYMSIFYFLKRRGKRMAVRDVTRQMSEITNTTVKHDDVVTSLRQMESDGIIQFNERSQTLFVRSGIMQ